MFSRLDWGVSVLLCIALSSCDSSVLEDRDKCPALLALDFSQVDTDVMRSVGTDELKWGVFEVEKDEWVKGSAYIDDIPGITEVNVEKGEVFVYAAICEVSSYNVKDGLFFPEGSECPAFYAYHGRVICRDEQVRDTIQLRKMFARMNVIMRNHGPYIGEISSDVCGYDVDGKVINGVFRRRLEFDRRGYAHVNLPRQMNSSMRLNLVTEDGTIMRSFALGDYIAQSGYDWMAHDLEDFTVEIDYIESNVRISTPTFSRIMNIEIVI